MENLTKFSQSEIPPVPPPATFTRQNRGLSRWNKVWITLTVAFLVLLPKGGIKFAGIPLTWGYLFLGLSVCAIIIFGILPGKIRLPARCFLGYLITVPFAVCAVLSIMVVGKESTGLTIGLFVVTAILPIFFLLVVAPWLQSSANLDLVLSAFRKCFFLVALFGVFSFGLYAVTKKVIEVPYLTVNAADQDSLLTKNNARGNLQKLTSTYNNGNIYAVCIIMLLPLYCALERRVGRQWIVKASVVLTLSRTAWFGLFICEVLMLIFQQRKRPKTIVFTLLGMVMAGILILVFLNSMGRGVDWLADSSLGGRKSQLSVLQDVTFFASEPFSSITEILPLSILQSFGIMGFLLFAFAMVSPIIGFLSQKKRDSLLIASVLGCVTYYAMSISDGAFLLIPVMAFFWFLTALVWLNPASSAASS